MECRSDRYFVPFEQMQLLRKSGRFQVGVDNDLAVRLMNEGVLAYYPPIKTVGTAGNVWTFVSFAVPLGGAAAAFMYQWWIFIPALIIGLALYKANKKGTSQNFLDVCLAHENIYELMAKAGGIRYRFESRAEADGFLRRDEGA